MTQRYSCFGCGELQTEDHDFEGCSLRHLRIIQAAQKWANGFDQEEEITEITPMDRIIAKLTGLRDDVEAAADRFRSSKEARTELTKRLTEIVQDIEEIE